MKLVFLGPPGAGKGTIAVRIKDSLNIPHISTGDLFRNAIKNKTELGTKVKDILDRGDLVPDSLTTDIVKERLSLPDAAEGFILDGYPRTLTQASDLEGFADIKAAVNLVVPEDLIIRRLSGRRMCRGCGKSYHIDYLKPLKDGICDDCGGELYTRDDDQPEAIKNRLQVYKKQTEPLIQYYKEKGLLVDVDGSPEVDIVVKDVLGRIS